MCLCVYVFMWLCVYVSMCLSQSMLLPTRINEIIRAHIRACMCVHTHIHAHIRTHTRMYVRTYAHISIYTRTYAHIPAVQLWCLAAPCTCSRGCGPKEKLFTPVNFFCVSYTRSRVTCTVPFLFGWNLFYITKIVFVRKIIDKRSIALAVLSVEVLYNLLVNGVYFTHIL